MGMAASQARYLALSARKTNVEYEGQQINQSRTALANQSANLFNQMLDMEVPTPPSTSDFTTIQYSFSDGSNTEVLSNYYQLGTADSDYNYVVTTYHNESVYTGSRKKLNDPQVQATTTHDYSYDPNSIDNNTSKTVLKAEKNEDGSYLIETSDGTTSVFRAVSEKEEDQVKAINYSTVPPILKTDSFDLTGADKNKFSGVGVNSEDVTVEDKTKWAAATDSQKEQIAKLFGVADTSITVADYSYNSTTGQIVKKAIADIDNGTALTDVRSEGTISDEDKAAIAKIYGDTSPAVGAYYKTDDGAFIKQQEYIASSDDTTATYNEGAGYESGDYYTDGKSYVTESQLDDAVATYQKSQILEKKLPNTIEYLSVSDDPTFSNYTAVGNCTLTQMTESDMAKEDIKAEIDQIIKDMQKSGGDPVAAENLKACFDADGNYTGGIYQFQMNGVTYYTTESDLNTSLGTSIVDNGIDVQQDKLRYYNAIYQDTRVEETQKALLETDGDGRFSSVKLENDSVKYTLNTETVTDEDAYNDAMNRYYYEQAQYEKSVSDINAKTEVLQAQDRTLELRLEQLNTEQSALQNEMEAVKKVVDKHVEQGFKTFGG